MAWSRPLVVAVVAFALLTVSVGFEVLFQRSFSVEVHDEGGWATVGQSYAPGQPPRTAFQSAPIRVTNETVLEFRVRVDNGYPWSYSQRYDVIAGNLNVANGTLSAPARDSGVSTFTIPAKTLLAYTAPKSPDATRADGYFTIQIGGRDVVSANVQLEVRG